MEWTYIANLMQSDTGDKEELFDKMTFHESTQQVYWKHHLEFDFSTKPDDPAVHGYTVFFACHFGGRSKCGLATVPESGSALLSCRGMSQLQRHTAC